MAKIPCPGSEEYNHIFGVSHRADTPIGAFIGALQLLMGEIGTSRGLQDFLDKECEEPCDKNVTGPDITDISCNLKPDGGKWLCVAGCNIKIKIDCVLCDVTAKK